jgi:hypothetical protein
MPLPLQHPSREVSASPPVAPSFSRHAKPRIDVILDSGAFSAWKLGKPIDLDAYCRYIKENEEWLGSYIALDYINPKDRELAASTSFANLKKMLKQGLKPLPVFHIGEDIDWLHRILDTGLEYIAIANSSARAEDRADDFYHLVFSQISGKGGLPLVKVHALGEGREKRLKSFPWKSADSTSWIYSAQRTGTATLPDGQSIGMRHDGKSDASSPDIDQLSDLDRAQFLAIMREAGIDPDAFKARDEISWVMRAYLSGLYFKKLQGKVRDLHPIQAKSRGFLHKLSSAAEGIEVSPFNLHLVIHPKEQWPLISKLNMSALYSYFYIQKQSADLRAWVLDPIRYIESNPKCSAVWRILEKHINAIE